MNVVDTKPPHHKDTLWRLTQLNDTGPIFWRCNKVETRHFCNRMPERVVKGPFRQFPAMQMSHRYFCYQGRSCSRKNFISVAKQQEQVRLQIMKNISKGDQA